jgi:hypothetical protein
MIGDISKSRSHTDAPRGRATSEDGVQNKDNLSPRVGAVCLRGLRAIRSLSFLRYLLPSETAARSLRSTSPGFSRFRRHCSSARRSVLRSSRDSQAQVVRVKLHTSGISIATSMTLPGWRCNCSRHGPSFVGPGSFGGIMALICLAFRCWLPCQWCQCHALKGYGTYGTVGFSFVND